MKKFFMSITIIIYMLLVLLSCSNSQQEKYYTISFITDCDTVLNDESYLEGTTIVLYNYHLKRPGYYFEGWYYEDDMEKKIVHNFDIHKDTVVHAKWDEQVISFSLNVTFKFTDEIIVYSNEFTGRYDSNILSSSYNTTGYFQAFTDYKDAIFMFNEKMVDKDFFTLNDKVCDSKERRFEIIYDVTNYHKYKINGNLIAINEDTNKSIYISYLNEVIDGIGYGTVEFGSNNKDIGHIYIPKIKKTNYGYYDFSIDSYYLFSLQYQINKDMFNTLDQKDVIIYKGLTINNEILDFDGGERYSIFAICGDKVYYAFDRVYNGSHDVYTGKNIELIGQNKLVNGCYEVSGDYNGYFAKRYITLVKDDDGNDCFYVSRSNEDAKKAPTVNNMEFKKIEYKSFFNSAETVSVYYNQEFVGFISKNEYNSNKERYYDIKNLLLKEKYIIFESNSAIYSFGIKNDKIFKLKTNLNKIDQIEKILETTMEKYDEKKYLDNFNDEEYKYYILDSNYILNYYDSNLTNFSDYIYIYEIKFNNSNIIIYEEDEYFYGLLDLKRKIKVKIDYDDLNAFSTLDYEIYKSKNEYLYIFDDRLCICDVSDVTPCLYSFADIERNEDFFSYYDYRFSKNKIIYFKDLIKIE